MIDSKLDPLLPIILRTLGKILIALPVIIVYGAGMLFFVFAVAAIILGIAWNA